MKCPPPCGKTRFDAEWRATLGAILIALRDNVALTPYRSPDCKTYHLSGHDGGKPRRSGRKTQAIRRFTKEGGTDAESDRDRVPPVPPPQPEPGAT